MACERPPAAFGGSPPVSGGELLSPLERGTAAEGGRGSLTRRVEIEFLRRPYVAMKLTGSHQSVKPILFAARALKV
jgi:hypothetical protein